MSAVTDDIRTALNVYDHYDRILARLHRFKTMREGIEWIRHGRVDPDGPDIRSLLWHAVDVNDGYSTDLLIHAGVTMDDHWFEWVEDVYEFALIWNRKQCIRRMSKFPIHANYGNIEFDWDIGYDINASWNSFATELAELVELFDARRYWRREFQRVLAEIKLRGQGRCAS